jgi:hypothetical protein
MIATTNHLPRNAPPSQAAANFFAAAQATVDALAERWADEKDYECVDDYAPRLTPIAKRFGVTIIKMHARPFGLSFSVDDREYRIKSTQTTYSYARIA